MTPLGSSVGATALAAYGSRTRTPLVASARSRIFPSRPLTVGRVYAGPQVNLERLDLLRIHSKPGCERRECVGVRLLHLTTFDARYLLRADPVEVLTA